MKKSHCVGVAVQQLDITINEVVRHDTILVLTYLLLHTGQNFNPCPRHRSALSTASQRQPATNKRAEESLTTPSRLPLYREEDDIC